MEQATTSQSGSAIHDTFFREVFSNLGLARDFLRQWLPHDILAHVDLDHLKALPTSQISQAFGGSEAVADLLFECRFAKRAALFYVLVEHKSYPDKFVPLQAHVYQAAAWWHYHRQYPRKRLPMIVTLVVHHAKSAYRYSTDLRDLIDAPRELVERHVLQPFQLIDLAALSDEQCQGSEALQAVELIMKHIRDDRLDNFMDQKMPRLLLSLIRQDEQLALALLKYVMDAGNLASVEQFLAFIRRLVAPTSTVLGEKIMTLSERLRQEGHREGHREGQKEGLKKGHQEGLRQGCLVTAQRLLNLGAEVSFIEKATGLTQAEIESLQAQPIL